jgi:peptidase M28-like protein
MAIGAISRMRRALFILVLVSLCSAQKFRFNEVDRSTIAERERHPPATQDDRRIRLRELFIEAGCAPDEISEEHLDNAGGVNVICRLPGKTGYTIVVGANYYHTTPDNWTAASLLPSLFQSLAGRRRHHTFVFVAFADDGADLAGSRFFTDHMGQEQLDRTEAMVNLDALGFSPTKIAPNSDKDLVKDFVAVMYVLKMVASQVDISKGVHVDSEPFSSLNIPQITLHSLTQDVVADLQSREPVDPASAGSHFRPDFYYNSYHLISGYLAYLDEIIKPKHKK